MLIIGKEIGIEVDIGDINMDNNALISCFQDTVNLSYSDILRFSTLNSQSSNRIYYENFVSARKSDFTNGKIIVEENTSFAAAKNIVIIREQQYLILPIRKIPEAEYSMVQWRKRSVCVEAAIYMLALLLKILP